MGTILLSDFVSVLLLVIKLYESSYLNTYKEKSKMQTMIDELCEKLRCTELAADLARVSQARESLAQLQKYNILKKIHKNAKTKDKAKKTSSNLLLETKTRPDALPLDLNSSQFTMTSEESVLTVDNSEISQEGYETESSCECEDLTSDAWLGVFHGYDILQANPVYTLSANKQCIELALKDDLWSIEGYLRAGIRCFMIDLFIGTTLETEKLILDLRENELRISKEYGFLLNTTLIALLSPRFQYTGIMAAGSPTQKLEKGHNIIITTQRQYSTRCSIFKIYVNAAFLLDDCQKGDFILVGPSIQLAITEVLEDELKCIVKEPGLLSSRLPVRFPARCRRSQISREELEDLTFAREVGINVLVSYMPGSLQYSKELYNTLDLLKCENLRLFTRLVINEYQEASIEDIEWIAQYYEGFVVEINLQQYNNCCACEESGCLPDPNILELSPTCTSLMAKLFSQQKPIILNPALIAERQLRVLPQNMAHIFQFPDKFLFSKESFKNAFKFFLLKNAFDEYAMSRIELSLHTFFAASETADDLLAQACVVASFQSQIKAIVVCSAWPTTAIKVSHFRPEVPVILVSSSNSLVDYISLYHLLTFMHFPAQSDCNYNEYVTKAFMFSLIYLKTKKIVHDGESVLLAYAANDVTRFCDNYLIYKFSQNKFALNLERILFA